MKKWLSLLLLAATALLGAAAAGADDNRPDFGPMLRIINSNGMAHGCPIAPNIVLTAGHVADPRPLDPSSRLFPSRYSTSTQEGWLDPLFSSRYSDLAVMVPVYEPLTRYYRVATARPEKGEHLYWVGYNWERRKQAMQPVVFDGIYLDTIAGHVITDTLPQVGSSGGCVLNARNEVVGIISWGRDYSTSDGISIGPAVFAPWDRMLNEQIAIALQRSKEE